MFLNRIFRRLVRWFRSLFSKPHTVPPAVPPETEARVEENPADLPFYTVYIPTLDGRFFYLSDTPYSSGDIVRIPFGPEDREIFGIVEEVRRYPIHRTPLPLWKMKYILGKAPRQIADTYRRLTQRQE